MPDILGLLARLANSNSVEELWATLVDRMAGYGFSRVNYGFTRNRHDLSIGSPDDVVFMSSIGEDYIQHYFTNGFYATTPLYRWAAKTIGSTTWRWVDEDLQAGRLSAEELSAIELNRQLGITAGISISFPETSPRSKGAMGLIADTGMNHDDVDKIWAAHGPEIMAICNMFHLKVISLPMKLARRKLTDRQREALEWVADGKTNQDIALIMGISAAMVEKHLRLARAILDVETTAHAVAKATILNQIFMKS